jgi:NAD(P)-dependent dehydrogenase (short-subunit alcohol dehydrogenase family)
VTQYVLDVRFSVNTIAPFLLTKKLVPSLSTNARVVNVSSAAQAPVNIQALAGKIKFSDMEVYSQSKLGIINWTSQLVEEFGERDLQLPL